MSTTKSKSQILFEKSKQVYFNCSNLITATRHYNRYISERELTSYHLHHSDTVKYVITLIYKPNAYNINLNYIEKFIDLSFSIFSDYIAKYDTRFIFLHGAFKSFLKKVIMHEIYSYNKNTKEFDFIPFDFEDFFNKH